MENIISILRESINVKKKNMDRIIVTGGLGFIGSNLIDLLLKKNFFVINIDKVTYSSNFYNVKEFKKIKIIDLLNVI